MKRNDIIKVLRQFKEENQKKYSIHRENLKFCLNVTSLRDRGFKVHGFDGLIALRRFSFLSNILAPLFYKMAYYYPEKALQIIAIKYLTQNASKKSEQ